MICSQWYQEDYKQNRNHIPSEQLLIPSPHATSPDRLIVIRGFFWSKFHVVYPPVVNHGNRKSTISMILYGWCSHWKSLGNLPLPPFTGGQLPEGTIHHVREIYPLAQVYGGFLKWGYPQIVNFLLGFSTINHPFWVPTFLDGLRPWMVLVRVWTVPESLTKHLHDQRYVYFGTYI